MFCTLTILTTSAPRRGQLAGPRDSRASPGSIPSAGKNSLAGDCKMRLFALTELLLDAALDADFLEASLEW
jgi:hypothetical protein